MLKTGIARTLIRNIPPYLGGTDILASRSDCLRVVELLPEKGVFLDDYNSDRWDLSASYPYTRSSNLILKFDKADETFRTQLKDFICYLLDKGRKASTLNTVISYIARIFNAAVRNSRRQRLYSLTTDGIIDTIKKSVPSHKQQKNHMWYAIQFVTFLNKTGECPLVSLSDLEEEHSRMNHTLSGKTQANHHPDIPKELFDIMVQMFYDVLHDEKAKFSDRMTAGIMLMDSQMGLRASELCIIETDLLHYMRCDDGVVRPYVIYNMIKGAKSAYIAEPVRMFCNELLHETINYLLALRERSPEAALTDFVYTLSGIKRYPLPTDTMDDRYHRLMERYLADTLEKDWKGIGKRNAVLMSNQGRRLSIPHIHSIRVHVISEREKQGVPLAFNEAAASHLLRNYGALLDGYYSGAKLRAAEKLKRKLNLDEDLIDKFDTYLNQAHTINDTERDRAEEQTPPQDGRKRT